MNRWFGWRKNTIGLVDAMNPPKPLVRIVAKNGLAQAGSDPLMAQWGMKDEVIVDDPIYRARILQQLQACHGKGDDSLYQTMLDASMVRDEGMAKTLVQRLNRIRSESRYHGWTTGELYGGWTHSVQPSGSEASGPPPD